MKLKAVCLLTSAFDNNGRNSQRHSLFPVK